MEDTKKLLKEATSKIYDRHFCKEIKITRRIYNCAKTVRLKKRVKLESFFDDHTYRYGYREIKMKKSSGGKRSINIPHPDLKEMQNRILKYLLQFPAHKAAHGFVKERSYHSCVRAALKARQSHPYMMFFDVRQAFPSIDKKEVYSTLIGLGVEREIAKRIVFFCCHREGFLPQGAPTSPHILNLVYHALDEKLSRHCRPKGMTYLRYADNFFFLSNKPFSADDRLSRIIRITESFGRMIHPPVVVDDPKKDVRILGLNIIVSQDRIELPPETKDHFRQILHQASIDSRYHERARGVLANLKMIYGCLPPRFAAQIQKHPLIQPVRR